MAEPRLRPCRQCGVPQPLDHYYPDPERADGLDSRCKDCFRQRSAANRARKRAAKQAAPPAAPLLFPPFPTATLPARPPWRDPDDDPLDDHDLACLEWLLATRPRAVYWALLAGPESDRWTMHARLAAELFPQPPAPGSPEEWAQRCLYQLEQMDTAALLDALPAAVRPAVQALLDPPLPSEGVPEPPAPVES